MTDAMRAAFALGSGFMIGGLYGLIVSVLAAGLFLWAAWTIVGQYLVWMQSDDGEQTPYLVGAILTVLALVTVLVSYL